MYHKKYMKIGIILMALLLSISVIAIGCGKKEKLEDSHKEDEILILEEHDLDEDNEQEEKEEQKEDKGNKVDKENKADSPSDDKEENSANTNSPKEEQEPEKGNGNQSGIIELPTDYFD